MRGVSRPANVDALAVELRRDELAEQVVAERGDERGAQPEPLRRRPR